MGHIKKIQYRNIHSEEKQRHVILFHSKRNMKLQGRATNITKYSILLLKMKGKIKR